MCERDSLLCVAFCSDSSFPMVFVIECRSYIMESMDIDTPGESNRDVPLRLLLRPVRPMESGEGLPYAPENWPNPGDTWRWKVGPRVSGKGTFVDRYLYPPKHLPGLTPEVLRKSNAFRSRSSLERYIRQAFPKADVRKFFASFSWSIPSTDGQVQSTLDLCYMLYSKYIQFQQDFFPPLFASWILATFSSISVKLGSLK